MKRINKTIVLFVFILLMAISYSLHQSTLVQTRYPQQKPTAPKQTLNLYRITGKNGSSGYIDSTGKVIIEPRFWGGLDFAEGLAAVAIAQKWGYIDPTGQVAISPQFEKAFSFSNGRAAVGINGKMGYIDKTGKIVIPPQFDLTYSRSFSEGLAAVQVESGRIGYIDTMGQMVIPAQISNARDFHEGFAYVQGVKELYRHHGFINKKGKPAISRPPAGTDVGSGPFSEGLTVIYKDLGAKRGYMDTAGRIAIEPKFDEAKNFSEGLAEVGKISARSEQQGPNPVWRRWGYIDPTGKMVIPAQFKETKAFSEGLAAVTEDGQKWGYIDRKGQIVIPMQFDSASSFKGELARVSTPRRWGYINCTGNFVWFRNKRLINF